MSILEIQNLSYYYSRKRNILKNISLTMETGKVYAILGPSGCGKTTLLSLLGGLDSPTGGKIICQGQDIAQLGLDKHRKQNVSFIFQSYNLIDYMTPIENVNLTSKSEAKPILKRLGLTDEEAKRNVLKLSGGQQQRVAIARALASDSPILLADEPTGNLDENTSDEIFTILQEMAHEYNKCVVVVTHSQALAKRSDIVVKLRKGDIEVFEKNMQISQSNKRGNKNVKN